MRGVYYNGTEAQYREDLPKPVPAEGQSLLKILMSAVCSTDREILKGYRPEFRGIMGHEFVGLVEESDRPELIGKRVVGEINENCGSCLYCRTGRPHHCANRHTPGLSRDGCFTEYMVLKTDLLHVVPDALPTEQAIFTEPLAAAFEITTQVNIAPGTPVGLLGDGRLALCIANVMHLIGADLTVIGKHQEKLKLFESLGKTVLQAQPESFEIVIDATGAPQALEEAVRLVRKAGIIVMKSTCAAPTTMNFSLIPVNELTIIGSRCGPFEPALEALASGQVKLPPIELYALDQFAQAFSSHAFKSGFKP